MTEKSKVNVLVLAGYGINCEEETAHAFRLAGAEAEIVHLGKFLIGETSFEGYNVLAIPGGFSFGDDISSGRVLANKMKNRLGSQLTSFVKDGNLVIGICNGFQALVKMGMLPGFDGMYGHQIATLAQNASGRFEDRWVRLAINPKSHCVWTRGISSPLYLPIRHGEGRFLLNSDGIFYRLQANNHVVLQYADESGKPTKKYPLNPNGSLDAIAGICDESGRVFGIMPHPEAFLYRTNHPRWTREQLPYDSTGLAIFKNAVNYFRKKDERKNQVEDRLHEIL